MTKISRFEFISAKRVLFGKGTFSEIGKEAAALGKRAFVVCGKSRERIDPLLNLLEDADVESVIYSVSGEPNIKVVIDGVEKARNNQCDLVIGYGGGSPLDAGKAVGAMLSNPGELLDYLEVIGRGRLLEKPSAPFIAIPTTAGTGTEVTKNAVIGVPEQRIKVSLRSSLIMPELALVDPELTYSCSPEVTAFSGMDALTQLIEPFTSPRANPIVDGICREGIHRAVRSLKKVYFDGKDEESREDMAIASLFGGFALTNAGLGAVHGFSGVMGGMYPIPHGALCARLLPFVMKMNIQALKERDPGNPVFLRYAELAKMLTGNHNASIEDGVDWVFDLISMLEIPPLKKFGVNPQEFSELVRLSRRASSMKANGIVLTDEELNNILINAY